MNTTPRQAALDQAFMLGLRTAALRIVQVMDEAADDGAVAAVAAALSMIECLSGAGSSDRRMLN